jgi:hypothetical protein
VIVADVVQAPNYKQQLEPMLGKLAVLPDELGNVEALLADNGYFGESNVNACASAGIDPMIAMGREAHHLSLDERFAGPPQSPPKDPTPLAAMDHRLKTPEGKKQSEANSQIGASTVAAGPHAVLAAKHYLHPPDLPVRKRTNAPGLRCRRKWPTITHVTSLRQMGWTAPQRHRCHHAGCQNRQQRSRAR